jgi:hypothetical protein
MIKENIVIPTLEEVRARKVLTENRRKIMEAKKAEEAKKAAANKKKK